MIDLFGAQTGAKFDDLGYYRYKLWRIWNPYLPLAMCIGLNPSTANAHQDDPTIRTLKNALNTLGFGGFYMCNLFAWISPHPEDMIKITDPIGQNDQVLKEVSEECDTLIYCWGTFTEAEERARQVMQMLPNGQCFGHSQNGSPIHPMALMYSGQVKSPELIPYQ